ncbi:nucleoside diphosphate kinase regulator [Lysobacter sp. TY2-98]|uniref:nucleoside diphosphate kinase regulator n=1 Tax=Lysobacter sp. TY2-98 TaxID=2290922 RepID=UPI000E209F76|nr:nucleoside diphosphate kinase regulator [Lysobacter sp. TY2-98]AXK71068.1 nucleoside diphosphate kinase regulator [Lysobacter sp. TY2-98]
MDTPRLIMSVRDATRLEAMLASPMFAGTDGAERLENEIARADVREAQDVPADVVTMNSSVVVEDESTGTARTVRVVYPDVAAASPLYVSVLAPVGAALLGLRAGDAIDWQMPGGRTSRLRVKEVLYQPEAAGLPE